MVCCAGVGLDFFHETQEELLSLHCHTPRILVGWTSSTEIGAQCAITII
jgi:hypothetical protein